MDASPPPTDLHYWMQALLSTESPLLPWPWLERLYLSAGWSAVLGASAAWLLQRWWLSAQGRGQSSKAWALGLPAVLALSCWLPGTLSPAYWLGLAFRAPSLVFTLLCALVLWRHYRMQWAAPLPLNMWRPWGLAGVLLGWVLLLDAFALWPVSLYAVGFAPLALGVMVALGLLPWLLRGAWPPSALLVLACVLFVALRLPSGNLWDALMDPLLWLLLQVSSLRRLVRRH